MFVCMIIVGVTVAGDHSGRCGSGSVVDGVMFFVLLAQFFPWDHPLPSNAKCSAFVSRDIRSSILVVVCTQSRPGLLLAIHSTPLISAVPPRARLCFTGEAMHSV